MFASYLEPLGISSIYIVPIISRGRLLGMLTVEDPQRGDRAASLVTFCDALSILLALRFAAVAGVRAGASRGRRPPGRRRRRAEPAPFESFGQRQSRLERR